MSLGDSGLHAYTGFLLDMFLVYKLVQGNSCTQSQLLMATVTSRPCIPCEGSVLLPEC